MRNIVDIEKTIEFILSHQANAEVQMEKFREGMLELRAAQAAQAEAQTVALAAQAEELRARIAALEEVHAKDYAKRELLGAKTDARLAHAIRLSARDARSQRKRHQELDEKITQLAAAQLVTEEKMQVTEKMMQVTEEKLQRFIDSMQRGTNGHP
jgi:hypothetical protein